jgi:methionyl-tRNA formyltransferase
MTVANLSGLSGQNTAPGRAVRAVVFAYHTVGVKCLEALTNAGFDISLVISHEDNPNENIWFESVSDFCKQNNIEVMTPEDASGPELQEKITSLEPDYIFSFYYRHMIPMSILSLAKIAALNMHGSLLPKYRGRVPINWAILHGETQTGATLHVMEEKPDAGDIVSQKTVQIGSDETAFELFNRVADAAVEALKDVIPELLNGNFPRRPNRLQEGSYFGGRKPEDGRIDWNLPANQVYNLVRAVAPPYPGAFTDVAGRRWVIAEARLASLPNIRQVLPVGLQVVDNRIYGICGDGRALWISRLEMDGQEVSPSELQEKLLNHS